MLTEFLLTPDALAESIGADGCDGVRALQTCLLPFAAVPTALVCRLGDDEWTTAASKKIALIPNENQRQLAMSLLAQLVEQLAVNRPSVDRNNDDEVSWIDAGVRSSSKVPIGGIVVSGRSTPPTTIGSSINDFIEAAFWEQFANPRIVSRSIHAQERELRAICTHAEWIIIRLPQIRGGNDDEIVTVKQIIRLATEVPAGFSKSEIDLHLCVPQKVTESRLLHGIREELSSFLKRGVTINVTTWPEKHFINREVIGGNYGTTSRGVRIRRPLWWLTMTHVAVGGKNAEAAGEAGNTWSLFSRQKAHQRFEQINADQRGTLHRLL